MKKHVFVVEDEPDLLDLISELLAIEDLSVIAAGSSERALELWKLNSEKIDLLLTDLTLPGNINGFALAEQFRAEKPDLKIIFSSGHPAETIRKKYPFPINTNFLQKPFDPAAFWRMVRSVLNS